MGASVVRQLKRDEQDLREALSEQEEIIANTQATILRLDGALTYVTKLIEHLAEQKKPKEDKEDASTD